MPLLHSMHKRVTLGAFATVRNTFFAQKSQVLGNGDQSEQENLIIGNVYSLGCHRSTVMLATSCNNTHSRLIKFL